MKLRLMPLERDASRSELPAFVDFFETEDQLGQRQNE